jgi:Tol biopolymer transport system component
MRKPGLAVLVVVALVVGVAPPSTATDVPGDDSDTIAFGGTGGIEVWAGGSVTTLVEPQAGSPLWSPGGARIAYLSNRDGVTALYTEGPEGPRRIADAENLIWRWAPNGRRIGWVSTSGSGDLMVTNLVTGELLNLTNGGLEAREFDWSPDGRLIVSGDASSGDLYTIPSTGGPPRNLTQTAGQNEYDPRWSPDGSLIAFASNIGVPSAIEVMAPDGTGRRALFTESETGILSSPAWASDATRLGFALTRGSPVTSFVEYYTIDAGGGAPRLLASGGGYGDRGPFWSPDGQRVAIVFGGWGRRDLTLVDADGRNRISLSDQFVLTACTGNPSWASDGSRLAFDLTWGCTPTAPGPAPPGQPEAGVFVVGADGVGPVRLASGNSPDWKPAATSVGLVDPSTGLWHLQVLAPFYFGDPGDSPFLGDWDGDGVDTPGLYRRSDGFVYLRDSNSQGIADIRFFFGNPGDVPLAGDFDGDGDDTVSIYRPTEQRFFVINELGSGDFGLGEADYSFLFGDPGDQPVVGDWDGDGVDEIGLYRTSSGSFYYRNTLDSGVADGDFFFGDPGDRFISGDWGVADSHDTPAVFRPADATFHFRHLLAPGLADSNIGIGRSNWLPVAGTLGN